jgi:Alr-MurF fusion protein
MHHTAYTLSEIAGIVKGKLSGAKSDGVLIHDILIDSRQLISPQNCLFFALVTSRNDGHKYIGQLYEKGLRAFVVGQKNTFDGKFADACFIEVENTLAALQALAAAHRVKYSFPVIGITGSNGKTIIKEWLFQLLSPDKDIIRSPKSYNSQIGVPLSVWQIDKDHELGIFEAGISEPDEMEKLQHIIKPDIGVFTNIGQAHDENFIHGNQKVGEKLKLFTKVKTLIYCFDHTDIHSVIIRSEILHSIDSFTWSTKSPANLQIEDIRKNGQSTNIFAEYQSVKISISIPFIDKASIENAIHCWCVMLLMGYDPKIISERMLSLTPIAMRLELKEGINNCTLINDFYNSDVNALGIALDFLNQQNQHRQKTLVLSDILQSGRNEIDLYTLVAEMISKKGVEKLIGIGPSISRQAEKFNCEKQFFYSTDEFISQYPFASFNNQSILLKGARVFEFERISNLLQQKAHETVLEINLNNLVHNLNYYRKKLSPGTRLMVMVKAFGYGSGSFEIANVLQFHQVDYLAVAYADEGIELRKAGINTPIMVMSPEESSFDAMIKHQLEPEVFSFRILDLLEETINRTALPKNKPVKIHLKLETGMNRLGFKAIEVPSLIDRIKLNPMLKIQSVFSHLAASDMVEHDDFTHQQIEHFESLSNQLTSSFPYHIDRHILNSAGISRFPHAHYDMVRLGIGLYGVPAVNEETERLETVVSLRSIISQINEVPAYESIGYRRSGIIRHESRIGVVPIGYADGLFRRLGNGRGNLYVNGTAAPIVGDVCMDMCMIDLTEINASEGDPVVIFDRDHPIGNIAEQAETIPYEILTRISRRVKRVYFQE